MPRAEPFGTPMVTLASVDVSAPNDTWKDLKKKSVQRRNLI